MGARLLEACGDQGVVVGCGNRADRPAELGAEDDAPAAIQARRVAVVTDDDRATLALSPIATGLETLPADVPRTAAGMFTISYTCAIIIPTICGALWDLTGKPWTAFVPLCLCAVALTVLGTIATRRRPAVQAAPGT